jgi:hypothetical protein
MLDGLPDVQEKSGNGLDRRKGECPAKEGYHTRLTFNLVLLKRQNVQVGRYPPLLQE